MHITATSIKLRSIWSFFKLSWLALHIARQVKAEKGLIAFKKTGFGLMHYTLTHWQTEADLKRFARSGQHQIAMKESAKLATEIRTHTYKADTMPDWATAKRLLDEEGKLLRF